MEALIGFDGKKIAKIVGVCAIVGVLLIAIGMLEAAIGTGGGIVGVLAYAVQLALGLGMLAGITYLYFWPAIMAHRRDHNNFASIAIVNLFFGWTLIGWVVSLAWAAAN